MSGRLNLVMALALVLCALSLVNSQYQARRLFIELESAQSLSRQLDVEWAQLQLDQSTLGKHARIEAMARKDLHMVPVTPARTEYLTVSRADAAGICRPLEADCGVANARQGTHPVSASRLALASDQLGIYPPHRPGWPSLEAK